MDISATVRDVAPSEARAAEAALLTEAVGKRQGRPKGSKNKAPAEVAPSLTVADTEAVDNADLLNLLSVGTETAAVEATATAEDDVASLLGPAAVEHTGADRYDAMDHAALYEETKKRCGQDIRAPRLAERIREATAHDKKIKYVVDFSEAMLRDLLREADAGKFKD